MPTAASPGRRTTMMSAATTFTSSLRSMARTAAVLVVLLQVSLWIARGLGIFSGTANPASMTQPGVAVLLVLLAVSLWLMMDGGHPRYPVVSRALALTVIILSSIGLGDQLARALLNVPVGAIDTWSTGWIVAQAASCRSKRAGQRVVPRSRAHLARNRVAAPAPPGRVRHGRRGPHRDAGAGWPFLSLRALLPGWLDSAHVAGGGLLLLDAVGRHPERATGSRADAVRLRRDVGRIPRPLGCRPRSSACRCCSDGSRWPGNGPGSTRSEFGISVFVILNTVLFSILVLWTASSLDRADRRRNVAEKELRVRALQQAAVADLSQRALVGTGFGDASRRTRSTWSSARSAWTSASCSNSRTMAASCSARPMPAGT